MEIQLSPTSTCNDARLDTATSLTHHLTRRRKHRRPLFGASPSSRVSPSSLRVLRQHATRRSFVVSNTAHNISLSLPLSGRAYVARSPLLVGCVRVGWWVRAWSDGERKALAHQLLLHAPVARPAAREAIAPPMTQDSFSTLSPATPPTPPTHSHAAIHLHATAPRASSLLPTTAPQPVHHHLHVSPLAPAVCFHNLIPLPPPSPHHNYAPLLPSHFAPRAVSPVSLSLARAPTLARSLYLLSVDYRCSALCLVCLVVGRRGARSSCSPDKRPRAWKPPSPPRV